MTRRETFDAAISGLRKCAAGLAEVNAKIGASSPPPIPPPEATIQDARKALREATQAIREASALVDRTIPA